MAHCKQTTFEYCQNRIYVDRFPPEIRNPKQSLEIQVEGNIIKQVKETKPLGVYIDNNLSWKKYVDETSKKVSSSIGTPKHLRPFISTDTTIKIYSSLIKPHFEYCSAVWDGISGHLSEKLQRLQNRAHRAITKSNNKTSSSLLRNALGWENLSTIQKRQKAYDVKNNS